jgi:pyrimidine operon attenuation protein/uracil phosphoribosyltransferase
MAFIDRRFKRNIPIEANYVGQSVDSIDEERVHVTWAETDQKDQVVLFNQIAK